MEATFYAWVKTEYDTRNTASSTTMATFDTGRLSPAKVARDLDFHGQWSKYADNFKLLENENVASGHGVSVKYPSGAFRTFYDGKQ